MSEHLTPDAIRSRSFGTGRRGYDRDEVEAFKAEVAAQIEALEARLSGVEETMEQLGIADLPDVKREIDAVSTQVGEVLQQAREAAAQMRARAVEDASRWRAEADAEARATRTAAERDSVQARRDAWETGTELLEQAQQRRGETLESADKDALFIRAEAEREALRMTGDARRDAEEAGREARSEAERVLMAAQAEAETILARARQSAESAQQRARALEQRRAELMGELEAARESIGQLEDEIDSRREALHAVATGSESTMRVIEPGDESEDWMDGDASVRIVPASRIRVTEPVDADALVAEVQELRARAGDAAPPEADTRPPVEPDTTTPPPAAAAADIEAEPSPPAPAEPEAEDEPESGDEPDAAASARDETETEAEPEAEAASGAETEADSKPEQAQLEEPEPAGAIDGLFAALRTSKGAGEPNGEVAPAAAEPEGAPGAAPPAAPRDAPVATPASEVDAFDVRDRYLIPIANRALRAVKRDIVELQNRVLEELRVAQTEWQVDGSMVVAEVSDDVARLVQECFVAGHAAAAEIVGEATTPQPAGPPPAEDSPSIAEALTAAVAGALERARAEGAGARQVAAAASRVFRAWRTDEAERRLRHSARIAYHAGLIEGFGQLGVRAVMAVASGRPCGECAAGSDVTWAPGAEPPDGSVIPPALLACDATVVPAAAGL